MRSDIWHGRYPWLRGGDVAAVLDAGHPAAGGLRALDNALQQLRTRPAQPAAPEDVWTTR